MSATPSSKYAPEETGIFKPHLLLTLALAVVVGVLLGIFVAARVAGGQVQAVQDQLRDANTRLEKADEELKKKTQELEEMASANVLFREAAQRRADEWVIKTRELGETRSRIVELTNRIAELTNLLKSKEKRSPPDK
jgi:peptidoglycan hydrolase CwlO-like protein